MQTGVKPQPEATPNPTRGEVFTPNVLGNKAEKSVVQRLRLLWNHRGSLGRAAMVGLLAGTLIAFVLPKRYMATTQLMPPDSQSSSGMAMLASLTARTGNNLGGVAGDLLGVKNSGALFIGVLRSRTVENRLVERFQLKKLYAKSLDEDACKKLAGNTSISEDRKSGIITLTVTDGDPKRAAALGQAYVEELDRLVAHVSTSSARREREFLEERLKGVKLDLDQASQEFSQFSSKNVAIDINVQGKAMVEAAALLQGQLIAAESELKGLQEIYTPNNVRVRSVQARAEELRRQLQKMGGTTEAQTSDSRDSSDTMYPSIRKLPILGVKYADFYRRTKIQEVVYETMTQQYELAKVQEAKETPSVKVLDIARIPERKSFPPRLLIMFLCTLLALSGATVLVLGRAQWSEVDAQNPGKVLAQEVFETVNARMPWATPNGSRVQAMSHKVWVRLVRQKDSVEVMEEQKELL
jgi:capsule polysaccharide export protein KpsE/RkpR